MNTVGTALSIAAYVSGALFLWKALWHYFLWIRAGRETLPGREGGGLVSALGDIFFLTRLMRVNPGLWPGEWLFHLSFVLVLLRHLAYFFNPVPGWVASLQIAGIMAGYVLPVSILYIFFWRFVVEKGRYVSVHNLFLTLMILAASATGLLLRLVFKADLAGIKSFIMGIVSLSPQSDLPGSWVFVIHLLIVLVLVPALPTHIFTAPITTIEARRREDERPLEDG